MAKQFSEEHKKKISDSNKAEKNGMFGKKHSEETKQKISEARKGKYCGSKNPMYGKKHSEEALEKMSLIKKGKKHSEITKQKLSELNSCENNPMFGMVQSIETRFKISIANKNKKRSVEYKMWLSTHSNGANNPNWRGGIKERGVALFKTYASRINKYETCVENEDGYLEVQCTYCGKLFIPSLDSIRNRINAIDSKNKGECRLYCSTSCKKECPIYRKSPEQLMKQDAIRAGLIQPDDYNREVQPELRKLVLARDNYTCQICGSTESLHCHHYVGVWQDQLESADMDNCVTLCRNCHIYKAHSQSGCSYYDMRRKAC
jgi:5-methylcytosine-specific restriction endonuclease McrA